AEDMTLSLKMASVTGENVVVRLLGAQLSEDLNLTGDLSIALDASAAPEALNTVLAQTVEASARLNAQLTEYIDLSEIEILTGDNDVLLSGGIVFGFDGDGPLLKADVDLASKLARLADETLRAEGPATFTALIARSGRGTARLTTPPFIRGNLTAPPAETVLTVRDLDPMTADILITTEQTAAFKPGRLASAFSIDDDGVVRIRNMTAAMAAAKAEGAGVLTMSPFGFKGDAAIDIPQLSDVPGGASGDLAVTATLDIGPNRLGVRGDLQSKKIAFGETKARDISLSVNGVLEEAIAIAGGVGALRAGGAPPVDNASLSVAASQQDGQTVVRLDAFEADFNDVPVQLLAPATLRLGDDANLSNLSLAYGSQGRINAAGRLSADAIAFSVTTKAVVPPTLDAAFDIDLAVDTREETPGALSLRARPADVTEAEIETQILGTWTGDEIVMTGAFEGYGDDADFGRREAFRARLPFAFSAATRRIEMPDAGLDAHVFYTGSLAPFRSLVGLDDQRFSGDVAADVRINGAFNALSARGDVTFKNGVYEHFSAGLRLADITGGASLAGALPNLNVTFNANAADDAGAPASVTADGQIVLAREGAELELNLNLDKAEILRQGALDVTASGQTRLAGALNNLVLTGNMTIDRIDAAIPDNPESSVTDVKVVFISEDTQTAPGGGPETQTPSKVTLNLNVAADDRIFIRGRGLDSEWRGDVSLTGDARDPRLSGRVDIRRGALAFAGRQFQIETGEVVFSPLGPPDPILNIRAKGPAAGDIDVYVEVTGPASSPSIAFTSEPALPEDDVVALVLFGKPARELSAFESLQLANAVARLTGAGPFGGGPGVFDLARSGLGLDVLSLGQSESGDTSLTVGKYVADGIFVSASQDATGKSGTLTVEVELTDRITIETDVGQNAAGAASINWKKDY
ncbi:MAG: translocation/assembly module TamB domain-containing protein, partial [Pseudomonadota bacterium]